MLTANYPMGAPSGRVGARPLVSSRKLDASTQSRNFVATNKLRHKLRDTEVVLHDSSWCHVRRGKIVARFASVGDAVANL